MPAPFRILSLSPLDATTPEILAAPEAAQIGEPLKLASDRSVWAGTLADTDVVFKLRRFRGLADRARFHLRLGPLDRELFGIQILTAAGIPTARPLARGKAHWPLDTPRAASGSAGAACIVLERLPGKTVLQHLADRDLQVDQEHALAGLIGEQVAQFVACGIHNRDHKPSNLIVTEPGQPLLDVTPKVAVIDAAGVGKEPRPKRMLASLYIEPLGCKCPPRRALAMRCLRAYLRSVIAGITGADASPQAEREGVKDLWRSVAQLIREHGDPTPKDDPLRKRASD